MQIETQKLLIRDIFCVILFLYDFVSLIFPLSGFVMLYGKI